MNQRTNIIPLRQAQSKPKISAIMVSYFTGPALFEAVHAVLTDPDIFELVLVDNGNNESTRQNLSQFVSQHANVRLLQGHGNIGFARACNYGAQIAEGDFFLFINPDAILSQSSARRMVECGMELKAPWIVGGLLRNADGTEQRGSRRNRLNLWSAITTFTGLHKLPSLSSLHREDQPLPNLAEPMPVVSGAFLMTDATSFEILGGFDEDYFLHVEDIDICERARRAGGEVYFQPKSVAMHYGSTSQVTRQRVEWEKYKGFVRYFWKFSKNPFEKFLVILGTPFMGIALMGRAFAINLRHVFSGR